MPVKKSATETQTPNASAPIKLKTKINEKMTSLIQAPHLFR